MPLFVCDECGSVENTALARGENGYWASIRPDRRDQKPPALCTACDPNTGKWHGKFEREQWDGERAVINRGGKS